MDGNIFLLNFKGEKGQAGAEAIVAVALLLAIVVVVMLFSFQREDEGRIFQERIEDARYCEKLSGVIDSVGYGQNNNFVSFYSEKSFSVSEGTVYVGDTYCFFYSDSEDKIISAGDLNVRKENKVVVFEQ